MEITNEALYCEKCSLQFDKKIVYDIHLSFVHKINIEVKSEDKTIEIKEEDLVLQCETTKSKQNIENSIPKGNKSHKCTICDYKTSRKGHLNQHIKSVHEGNKPHKCSICDSSFSQKGHLKRHIQSVHGGNKPHKCTICNPRPQLVPTNLRITQPLSIKIFLC